MPEKQEKITALLASVAEREETLKIVIKSIYEQVDTIHLVLNYYTQVPEWIKDKQKIIPHLNPQNQNAHDSIWSYVPKEGFIFVLDDDLFYPSDYIDKFIETIERHERRCVVTAYGSNIVTPVKDYLTCRNTYGFSDGLEQDIFVDMAGVGVTAFHASALQPKLNDFMIPFCRDLYFSILCAKHDVKIVSLQRTQGWITALKTPGETVWNITKTNVKLQSLKNRILKEQLLPLLFCDKTNRKYCLTTDYDFDERLVANTLSTLGDVSDCNTVIFSNRLKHYNKRLSSLSDERKLSVPHLTQYVTPEELAIGKMGSKMLTQYRFINSLPTGAHVISADADLYFLKDPFEAFKQDPFSTGFDVAVTTRPYKYQYEINGGVVMFRVSNKLKQFLNFAISQVYDVTWEPLIEFRKRFRHHGAEWYIDQDFWNAVYINRQEVLKRFGIIVEDIGPAFNFHYHADGPSTEEGKRLTLQVFKEKSASVIHLKSKLRELLFEGKLI